MFLTSRVIFFQVGNPGDSPIAGVAAGSCSIFSLHAEAWGGIFLCLARRERARARVLLAMCTWGNLIPSWDLHQCSQGWVAPRYFFGGVFSGGAMGER